MREIWKPVMLSTAVLLLSSPATQAGNPREESNAQHQVHTAVGFVEDLIGKRIRALAILHPHLESEFSEAQTVFLTKQEDADLEWLKDSVFPLLEGCSVENGVMLDRTQVQVKFRSPCGGEWTGPLSGVIVPIASSGPLVFQGAFDK